MRKAEPVAGVGALLLLVSLWLPWFPRAVNILTIGSGGSRQTTAIGYVGTASAWQVFTVTDILLALLGALMLAVPIASLATKGPSKAIGTALLASAFGWIAIPLVVWKLLDHGPVPLHYGAWLALAGSILAWLGSWFSLKDESTPGAVVPDIPRRPAPPVASS